MKPFRSLLLLFMASVLLEACNTLYNFSFIDIEVVEPGKYTLPEKYSSAVFNFNNIMDSYDKKKEIYYENYEAQIDSSSNMDSIAAKVYFYSAIENLKNQFYFDSISELPQNNKYKYRTDSLSLEQNPGSFTKNDSLIYPSILILRSIIKRYENEEKNSFPVKNLNPKLGLYSKDELKNIADTTNADLLISLDYFTSVDLNSIEKQVGHYTGDVIVYSFGLWNFYDLRKGQMAFFFDHMDTLMWNSESDYKSDVKTELPPRKDAVLNAADVMGIRFSEKLIPHWTKAERLYYTSGHVELKETDRLVKEGKWLEAAKIWKANVNNLNKNIAAKSMFNLAVACEMEGDLNAAMDWVVKSYHVFGNSNEIHMLNCLDYINILGKRKQSIKIIDKQLEDM